MEEKDGTGCGEWGKTCWVMGTPVDGGRGALAAAADTMDGGIGRDGRTGGVETISEITGPEAGDAEMPP